MFDEFQTEVPVPSPDPRTPYAATRRVSMIPPVQPPIRPWNIADFLLVFVGGLISLFAIAPLTELVFDGLINNEADPGLQSVIEMTGFTAAYIAVFFLTVMILILRGLGWQHLGLRPFSFRWGAIAVGLGVIFIPIRLMLVFIIAVIVEILFPGTGALQPIEAEEGGGFSLWYLLMLVEIGVMVVIFAPVVEELIFRGVLHNWVRGYVGRWIAVIISSTLFGLAHLSPLLIVSNIVLGLVLSTAYESSGSLWVPFIIHFMNNFLVAVMVICLLIVVALFAL